MTAAEDRREELVAVIDAQLDRAWRYGLDAPSDPRRRGRQTPAQAILAAADAYAAATATSPRQEAGTVTSLEGPRS